MAPRKIRADRDAAETGKKTARAKAEKAFKAPKAAAPASEEGKALKSTVMDLGLPEKRDFAHYLKGLKGLKEKQSQITGLIGTHKKRAKEANVDPASLELAIKWEKADPMEFRRWLGGVLRACEVNGMDVPELAFNDESGLTAEEKAFQDGHRAGVGGKSFTDNPHDPGSAGNAQWEEGRMRGQAELLGQGTLPQAPLPGTDALEDALDAEDEQPVPEAAEDGDGESWPDDEQIAATSPAAGAAVAAGIGTH
jgi:hypothetical protein